MFVQRILTASTLLCLVSISTADYSHSDYSSYGPTIDHHDYGHHDDGHHHHHHHEEHHEAKPYEFGYSVKDPHHGTDFGQHESSDGHNVHGSYRVALPDGRTQIVTYHADWKTGFHADVKYEGEAHYPDHHGSGHNHDSGSLSHHSFSSSLPDYSSHSDYSDYSSSGGYHYPEPSHYSSTSDHHGY